MARTTLDIDDDVMAAARDLASGGGRSIGAVISDLARRGLTPARIDATGRFPVILSPPDAPAITPEMVRRGLDED